MSAFYHSFSCMTENSKFGNRGIICTSCLLLFSFILCVIIGATGPPVLQSRSDSVSTLEVDGNGDAKWIGSINDMMQLNQLFWLSVKVYRPTVSEDDIGVIETFVNVTGYNSLDNTKNDVIFHNRHDKHSIFCSADECSEFYIFGQSTIHYRSYDVGIHFDDLDSKFVQPNESFEVLVQLHTINSEVPSSCFSSILNYISVIFYDNLCCLFQYSKFELGWKIFFCLTTLLVLFLPQEGFFFKLYFVPYSLWSLEQTWVMGLLACLFFFNDPFFSAQARSNRICVFLFADLN
jgi:hypothetical protein